MNCYLAYDLKGIQSFLFSIPKLRYIIGGSTLIDRFDRKYINSICDEGTELIYAAAGKGVFSCASKDIAEKLKQKILCKALEYGFSIRFSINDNYLNAVNEADELYSYVPDSLEGHPCSVSGLYPVEKGNGKGKNKDIHSVIYKRIYSENELLVDALEERLLEKANLRLPPGLNDKNLTFFHELDSTVEETKENSISKVAAKALGNRNRWAVICMDGNDMGKQFKKISEKFKNNENIKEYHSQIKAMSKALDDSSHYAAGCGMQEVLRLWGADLNNITDATINDKVLLPIRPLAVGGDDIIMLCHVKYAFDFVKEACRAFNEMSRKTDADFENGHLWCATGGELTISAGILFCSTSLPLHSAISYAESLLASAKFRGREEKNIQNKPSPPCLDWEQVTDGLLDTPAMRRQREMLFFDDDIQKNILLTSRPYSLDDFDEVLELAKKYKEALPNTIKHQILPGLRQGYHDRKMFLARLAKNHIEIFNDLDEDSRENQWEEIENGYKTKVIDALLILEEKKRFDNKIKAGE